MNLCAGLEQVGVSLVPTEKSSWPNKVSMFIEKTALQTICCPDGCQTLQLLPRRSPKNLEML